MSAGGAAVGPRTRALLARADELEGALGIAGDRVPPKVAANVRAILGRVRERLALGVDHTVVALAGGTGSGKSSLFNALSGLQFADVGVRRPTTAEVTACVWAHDAAALLDWLGVSPERRIERESALDGETQADLRGLVLLDLPDHDSIEPEHRAVVDRVLPQVDVLMWVVDPQKYADDALHNTYLRGLSGHEGSMVMVLNQIDTVPTQAQASVLRDVDRLLREDGLVGVGVHAASAQTGEGLPGVRAVLARAVASRGVAETRAQAELDDAGRQLAAAVARAEPDVTAAATAAVEGLAAAAGLEATLAGAEAAMRRGSTAPVRLGPVQADRAAAVRRAWLDGMAAALPRRWSIAVGRAVPRAEALTTAVDARLAAVEVPTARPRAATVLRGLALAVALLALAAGGFTAAAVAGQGLQAGAGLLAGVTAALATLALGLAWAARRVRALVARRRVAAAGAEVRRTLAAAVDEALVRPTTAVLEDHRTVREAAGPLLATSLRHTDVLVEPADGAADDPMTPDVEDDASRDGASSVADAAASTEPGTSPPSPA